MLIELLHFSCSEHVHCETYCIVCILSVHADNDEQFHKFLVLIFQIVSYVPI